ncbi:MAG: fibronectin type III domain-containing protein, partial [Chloroflexota bacterium]|nr:fibronectin type III domain-containing protein [Chloroflexota bacterium]
QPDWVDLSKVSIPQADEQQRLLANLIGMVAAARKPLPRFWYLPRDEKAAVVMTGDDHGNGGTSGRFDGFAAASPADCSVAAWECIRGTSYIYPNTPITDTKASQYSASGFEIALHPTTNCADFTAASLDGFFADQLTQFRAKFPSLPAVATNRTHCVVWSDWASQPKVELAHGIRLDTTYYYWPGSWVGNRPGFFTGSGIPMRFADLDGSMIDVYQATTQMTDESGQTYPFTVDALLDGATGPNGYYGVFTANMHTDSATSSGADAIVAAAKSRSVPVVSAKQMLTWLDGRNQSSFGSIAWSGGTLSFTVDAGAGASGLRGMVPATADGEAISTITRNGSSIAFARQTIKGVDYAFFDATDGSYVATYAVDSTPPPSDTTPPLISAVSATATAAGTATVTWTTDEPSTSRVDYGSDAATLDRNVSDATLVTSHSVQLTGLAAGSTYHYRVTSVDADGNGATAPAPPAAPASFAVPAAAAVAFPSEVVIEAGSVRSGTFADLAEQDSSYLEINASSPVSRIRTAAWYGRMTGVPRALSSLKVSYAGFSTRDCSQLLQVYRWTTASWVQIDSRSLSTTEVTIADLSPPGAAADYVSSDGEVRVRVSCTSGSNFKTSGNLMKVTWTT